MRTAAEQDETFARVLIDVLNRELTWHLVTQVFEFSFVDDQTWLLGVMGPTSAQKLREQRPDLLERHDAWTALRNSRSPRFNHKRN